MSLGVQKCFSVLAVWDLFTVGRGTGRKKINLRQEVAVKGRGGAQWKREVEKESRERAEPGPGRVPASPVILCLHTQKFRTISQLPFQPPLKKGTDSFLVTHPLSSESGCYHGKIQTFGIPSGLPLSVVLQLQCKQQSHVMPVKSVCARGHIGWIKPNRTPHSGGSICTAGSVCIHVVLSVRSSRSVSLCLLCLGECIRHCLPYVGWLCQMPRPQRPLLFNQTRVPRGQGGTPPSMPGGKREDAGEEMWQKGRCTEEWRQERQQQQQQRDSVLPYFKRDGRGPSLFMAPLNILKLAWTPCPLSHWQELRASLCLASGVSLRRHLDTLGEHTHTE